MESSDISKALCYLEQLNYLFTDAISKSASGKMADVQISLSIAETIIEKLKNVLVKNGS